VLFAYEERDEAGNLIGVREFDPAEISRDPIRYAITVQINPFCGLYRRSAVLDAGGYDTDPLVLYNEDVAFHTRLALAALRFAADRQVAVINHRQTSSMSASNPLRCATAQFHVMRKTAQHPRATHCHSDISSRLWDIAGGAAAFLDFATADKAA